MIRGWTAGVKDDIWKQMHQLIPTANLCSFAWQSVGVTLGGMPVLVDDLVASPGRWFYFEASLYSGDGAPNFTKPEVAYHGTSLTSAKEMLIDSKIKAGPSATSTKTGPKRGVYCEGKHRVQNVLNYATHIMFGPWLIAVILELMVDRDQGVVVNHQWCQPEASVVITGIYTHVIGITKLFTPGYLGWFRVHTSMWDYLRTLDDVNSYFTNALSLKQFRSEEDQESSEAEESE